MTTVTQNIKRAMFDKIPDKMLDKMHDKTFA